MRPTHLKPTLDAEIAAYLAAGGVIKKECSSNIPEKYHGNEKDALRLLRGEVYIATAMRMGIEQFRVQALAEGFPQCYLHAGERKWYVREVRAWQKRNMSHV